MKKLITLTLLLLPVLAMAQITDVAVVEADPVAALFDVIAQWSSLSVLARAISIVVFGTYLIQKFVTHGKWKRLSVTLLGVLSGILMSISEGTEWWKAVIVGLISSGGGVAIYEAFKGLRKALGKK